MLKPDWKIWTGLDKKGPFSHPGLKEGYYIE